MREMIHGNVVPFAVPTIRLRRRAAEMRRQGRPVDAMEITRQAAQREDRPENWVDVADGLYQLACYEQAAEVLYRVLARENVPADAWMLLARCQRALGRREGAIDSLYHYLTEDPLSQTADAARAMLDEMGDGEHEHDAYRLPKLIRRGLLAWRGGDREAGLRRLRRAVRMSSEPTRLRVTIAMLMLAEHDWHGAVKELSRALQKDKQDARTMTALCLAFNGLGKRRMAWGLLEKSAPLCASPEGQEMFLTASWAIGAERMRRRFLEEQLRRTPCRVALMQPLAACYMQRGRTEQAKKLVDRMLRVAPDNMPARMMLEWLTEHPGERTQREGEIPRAAFHRRMLALQQAEASGMPAAQLLAPEGEVRAIIDWCFTLQDAHLQQLVLDAVGREACPETIAYLRELLTRPSVLPEAREQALVRLEELGVSGPLPMLMGNQMTMARSTAKEPHHSRWACFLRQLLEEAEGEVMPLVFYAADEWLDMSRRQHKMAGGSDAYSYAKAIEILFLQETGQEEAAFEIVRHMQVSKRRIERVLRGLAPHHELLKGED